MNAMHPNPPAPSTAAPSTAAPSTSPHALMSGGGTGGHVFPALAVAAELSERGWQVSWAGSRRGPEARLVGERQIPFYALAARPLVGRGPVAKASALATLMGSALAARRLMRRLDARVVLGTGGYASAPAVLGSRLAARPVVLMEPNAEAGAANRWLSRWATEAVITYEATRQQLTCPATVTGVPVRRAFFDIAEQLPAMTPLRILVLGGSQGAQQLNRLMPQALARLDLPAALSVVHQAGPQHAEQTRAIYAAESHSRVDVSVVPFLDDVAGAMAACHLVVSRAGAGTLAEICAAGRPSVLLPLTIAAAHQVGNARLLADEGAARLLVDHQATAEDLAATLNELLGDAQLMASMARQARHLARPGAAAAIADRLEHLGGTS